MEAMENNENSWNIPTPIRLKNSKLIAHFLKSNNETMAGIIAFDSFFYRITKNNNAANAW